MMLRAMLHRTGHLSGPLPSSIRAIEDIRGVRVIRLRGPVGRDIGPEANATDHEAARTEGVFDRPVLFDFKEATEVDSATIAYLVRALHKRVASRVAVGIVNAPPRLIAELEISRLQPLFRVFASEEEAIAALARNPARARPAP